MKRRILTVLMTFAILLAGMPATVSAASELPKVNDAAVCHTPSSDYTRGDCVLTSTKTMLRRYAISHGSMMWTTLTNAALRPAAAPNGLLKYTFNYENDGVKYTVQHGYFKSKTEKKKIKEIAKLLKTHKEGIVVWGSAADKRGGPHAVLVVKVSLGVVYAVDSGYNTGSLSKGVQKWKNTTMSSINKCSKYWAIKSASGKPVSVTSGKAPSTLSITGVTSPESLTKGKGFSLYGEIGSNYKIKAVEAAVINSKGNTVISQTAKPKKWMYDLHTVDADIKFGTLAAGNYKYRVTASDSRDTIVLCESPFTVSAKTTGKSDDSAAADGDSEEAPASVMNIRAYSYPVALREGDPCPVTGKVQSNYKITKVWVQVLDSNGTKVISKSAKPGIKTYDIKKLDSKVKFGTLDPGTYTYRIVVQNEMKKSTLLKKTFTVK